ncbi:RNA polymerase subunit sigma-70 [Actinoplanes sp. CA-051413]|uniref:RNA polymerase subunit sigma-70 n=1 Tax=Actinoplanes sp. CA-051413 TaxID=3239899 RepID=UPI003D99119B
MGVEFEALTAPYRRELLAHCYRMSGSAHDAEDLLQETLLRAWRAFGTYDETRASLRTWLYRIATNACLTALKGQARRPLPSGLVGALDDPQAPMTARPEVPWLQPWRTDPADVIAARTRLRLAFVAALQFLPARQRAILLLRDVLEFSAAEVAATLGTTTAAVNSGLQRARSRVGDVAEDDLRPPPDPAVVERYVAAFENADLDALRRLLVADVVLEMPPVLNWYVGADAYADFIARVWAMRGTDWRLLPIEANGGLAAAAYVDGRAHTIQVFEVAGGAVTRTVVFMDDSLFTAFGLPLIMPR